MAQDASPTIAWTNNRAAGLTWQARLVRVVGGVNAIVILPDGSQETTHHQDEALAKQSVIATLAAAGVDLTAEQGA